MTDTTPSATPTRPTTTATPPGTQRPRVSIGFSARDLVNVAIFAVLYVVIVFAVAMIGVAGPLAMLLTLPLSAIIAGVPYILFATRVRHVGMATLFGIVVGLLALIMGHPWQSTLVTITVALLAEVILGSGRYRSKWAAIWAYTAFSAWFIGPWIPLFLDRSAYLRSVAMEAMGADYITRFNQIVSVPAVLAMTAATVVCGFLGGLLGTALLRKHFRKAGLA